MCCLLRRGIPSICNNRADGAEDLLTKWFGKWSSGLCGIPQLETDDPQILNNCCPSLRHSGLLFRESRQGAPPFFVTQLGVSCFAFAIRRIEADRVRS